MQKLNTENLKLKEKNIKGITLIALVITIIVLLILAGVSVAMLTGQNGILTQAQRAKEATENAQIQEEGIIDSYENYISDAIGEVRQVNDSNPGVLEGSGSEQDPYTINSIEDLVSFAYSVANGNTYDNEYIKLNQSLDFESNKSYVDPNRENYYGYTGKLKEALTTGEGFNPIGTTKSDTTDRSNSFCGYFNGNEKQIINCYMNKDTSNADEINNFALFGVTLFGKIENLGITDVNYNFITDGRSNISGLVTNNKGTISNCYVTGSITVVQNGNADIYCTGLVVFNRGIIENCYNLATINGTITSDTNYSCYCAGITSNNEAEEAAIRNCYNIGNVTLNSTGTSIGFAQAGGIARIQDAGSIENCYNTGDINCEVNGEIIEDSHIGGIIGNIKNGDVTNVYNSGKIAVSLESQTRIYVGGIAGEVSGKLTGSYNVGSLNNLNQTPNCLIGEISGRAMENGSISNSFYLNNNQPIRVNLSNSCIATQVTSEQLKSDTTLDLLNQNGLIWKKDTSNINNGYPIFTWQ